jgi:mRNA-degrading endonuclease toxin of MazEF toxin-antitoxin module
MARRVSSLRWAVVIVDLEPGAVGHEQRGQRRALVVSHEPFHGSGMATVCPILAREPRYPGEVAIPAGQAGQTKAAVILCHQVRTIDLSRVTTFDIGGRAQFMTEPALRGRVRAALARQLGLHIPAGMDGATIEP